MGTVDPQAAGSSEVGAEASRTTTFPECPDTKVAFPTAASFTSSRDRPRRDIVPANSDAAAWDYPRDIRTLGSAAVDVATVVDPDHGDFALGLVDAVQHSIGPSAGREHTLELSA